MPQLVPVEGDPFGAAQKPSYLPNKAVYASLDKVFGPGKWKPTGDFRSPAREDQLRSQGAQTVAPGHISDHSRGTPDASEAHDIVVAGMTPEQAAAKLKASGWSGKLFPEGQAGSQGAHLHLDGPRVEAVDHDPFAPSGGAQPAATAKPAPPQPAAPQRNTGSSDYMTNVRGRAHEDLEAMRAYEKANPGGSPGGLFAHPFKALGAVGGAMDLPLTPLEGGVTALTNAESRNPQGVLARMDRAVGLHPEKITAADARRAGDIAGLAVPTPALGKAAKGARTLSEVGGEVRIGEDAFRAATRTATDKANALYSKWLETLKRYGFEPTPGMSKGKEARLVERTKEGDSLAQKFYVKQADRAEDSFQRAKYNYDLEPLGDSFKYRRTGPVGHRGVDDVYRTISGEFDKILPKVKLKRDAKLETDLGKIEGQVERLQGDETRRVFSAIDHDVRQQLGPRGSKATIDGRAFKQIESDITKDAKAFRVKGQWREADLLNDYLGALRSAMERHSSPVVAARLKQVNNAYARWSRTSSAAARRPDALGRFNTSDLLHATEQEDVTGGRSFARGKVPGQSFAKRAHDVMHPGPRLPSENDVGHIYPSRHGILNAGLKAAGRPVATYAAKRAARAARARELLRRQGLTGKRGAAAGEIAQGLAPQLALLSKPQQ